MKSFARFLPFFETFYGYHLIISDLKIFLFGGNPLTFVLLRPFLQDVTQLAHLQHDDSMPIIFFLVFVYFKVQKKLFFYVSKSNRKSDKKATKSDKTPTNTLSNLCLC